MVGFSLEQVFEYAESLGYSREEVDVRDCDVEYQVEFGAEDTEVWCWSFDSLDGVATDFEYIVWED